MKGEEDDEQDCLLADSLVGDSHHTWADKTEWKWSREGRAETRKVQKGEEMRRVGRGPDEAAKQLSLGHFLYSPAVSHFNQSLEVILLPLSAEIHSSYI